MFKGTKVTLRPIEKEDLKILLEIKKTEFVRNNIVGNFLGQNYEQMLDWYNAINNIKSSSRYTIIANESSKVIGLAGLYDIDHINSRAEFGVFLSEEDAGGGRGSEAISLIIDIGFEQYNLNRLYSHALSYNERSIKACQKLHGLKIEGTLKKHTFKNGQYIDNIVLAILRDDR